MLYPTEGMSEAIKVTLHDFNDPSSKNSFPLSWLITGLLRASDRFNPNASPFLNVRIKLTGSFLFQFRPLKTTTGIPVFLNSILEAIL
ncbi:MAG: hypothetical protein IPJ37_01650 [Bacteroidales bacterium]|nr:hypothetical protein [Bacteroidales bacterium]